LGKIKFGDFFSTPEGKVGALKKESSEFGEFGLFVKERKRPARLSRISTACFSETIIPFSSLKHLTVSSISFWENWFFCILK